jgi:hypothetical protein
MNPENPTGETGKQGVSWLLRFLIISFWLFGLGLVFWLAWRFRAEIVPYLQNANLWLLASSFLAFLFSLAAIIGGWVAIMRLFAPQFPLAAHIKIYCATLAARRLPGTVWYVGGRLVLYKQAGVSRAEVSLASGIELAAIIGSGLALGITLLPAALGLTPRYSALAALASVAASVWLGPRLVAWLAGRFVPLRAAPGGRDVLAWLGWFGLMWLLGGVMLAQIIRAFQPLPRSELVFVCGAWALSGALGALTFLLPSSFGVSDISLAILLAQIMPAPAAGTIAVITRILGILYEFLLAAAFLPWLREPGKQKTPGGG